MERQSESYNPYRKTNTSPDDKEEIMSSKKENTQESKSSEEKSRFSLSSLIPSSLSPIASLDERIENYELTSSMLSKLMLASHYFLKTGILLNQDDYKYLMRKKTKERHQKPDELKIVGLCQLWREDLLQKVELHSFDIGCPIQAIALHPYKKLCIAVATQNTVGILQPEGYEENFLEFLDMQSLKPREMIPRRLNFTKNLLITCSKLEFSPDGKYLAMIHKNSSKITLYDLESDSIRSHCVFGTTFNKLSWSPDGAYLAIASRRQRSIYIFEVSTWEYNCFSFFSPISVGFDNLFNFQKTLAWDIDANSLYCFSKEDNIIYTFVDDQFEKVSTAFGRTEVSFRKGQVHIQEVSVDFENPYESGQTSYTIKKLAFCFEKERKFYVFVATKQEQECTVFAEIIRNRDDITMQPRRFWRYEYKPPVKALCVFTHWTSPFDYKGPTIHKVIEISWLNIQFYSDGTQEEKKVSELIS